LGGEKICERLGVISGKDSRGRVPGPGASSRRVPLHSWEEVGEKPSERKKVQVRRGRRSKRCLASEEEGRLKIHEESRKNKSRGGYIISVLKVEMDNFPR